MSTILQALKRLEEQEHAVRRHWTPPDASQGFNTRHVLHDKAKRTWSRSRFLPHTFSALVLAAVAVAVFLYLRQDVKAPETASPFEAITARTEPNPPPDREVGRPVPPMPAAEPVEADQETDEPPMDGRPTAFTPADPKTPRTPTDRRLSDSYAGADRLEDGRLSIQAIAWSETVENRIAVINNRVVREGAVVDGFAIVRIDQDAVYARHDGRLWEVRFRWPGR